MGKSLRTRKVAKEVRIDEKRSERLKRPDYSGFLEKNIVHVLLITVIALLAYSNTFNTPFQLDDTSQIVENNLLGNLDNFILNTKGYNYNPSRFIGYLTFALNYYVGGFSVTGYHIVNIAIHIANALLVYALVLLTFKTPVMRQSTDPDSRVPVLIALFSALLFVSHPLQIQAVTYIVQRLTSLATLFYLLSSVMYVKARLTLRQNKARLIFYSLSFLCAVCAMKTKEIAFTLPATVVLYEFMFFKASIKKRLPLLLVVMLTLAIIPLSLMHSDKPSGEVLSVLNERIGVQTDISRWEYLVTQMCVIVTYLRLVFVPINQNVDYDYPIYGSLLTPPVFLSFLLLLAIAGFAIYLLYVSRQRDPHPSSRAACYRFISFGIFWFFITLSVQSSIVPIVDVIFEHRVYLPLAGLFIAIMAFIVERTMRLKTERVALSLLVLAVLLLSGLTYARNTVWMSKISLLEDAVEKSPNKARPHNNLGWEYAVQDRLDEALKEYQTALRLDPNYLHTHYYLGDVYYRQGRLDEALSEFQTALRLDPNYLQTHYSLGNVYFKLGHLDDALREFQAVLKHDPDLIEVHNNLGNVYFRLGRLDEALREFQAALRLNPDFPMAHNNLGTVYFQQGRLDEALREFQAALRIDPNHAGARRNLKIISEMPRSKG
ncbi:MAG: tetratricopeptide repeat protein [Syntrophales bacterium LBB04]|nr:tetratricopeptide repeat protein [Syntrophales bacterium LBB04]